MLRPLTTVAFALLVLGCARNAQPTQATAAANPAGVKTLVEDYFAASAAGDFEKVIALTHPEVVKVFGGREAAVKMLVATRAGMNDKLRAEGLAVKGTTVGEPGPFLVDAGTTYAIVPTTMEVAIPGATGRSKGFVLAVSPDQGQTWSLIDGGGLLDPKFRDRVLPNRPAGLRFPPAEKTAFVPNPPPPE